MEWERSTSSPKTGLDHKKNKKTLQIVGLEIEISKQGTPITGHWLPPSQTDYEMVDDVGLVEL